MSGWYVVLLSTSATLMIDRERFELLMAGAAKRRAEMPDYPDTPEQLAEQRETHDFMMALQSEVLYASPPNPERT